MLDKSPAGQGGGWGGGGGSHFNGFYIELRKKYPSAFPLAGEVDKVKLAASQKLPSLGPRTILKPEAFPDNLAQNTALLGSRASHAFLLKVENERSKQRSSAEKRPSSGRPLIVKGNQVVVPAVREQVPIPAKQLRLPSLSNQIEQNRAALRNRLNNWVPPRALRSGGGPVLQSQSSPGGGGIEHPQTASSGWNSFSERSEDAGSGSEVRPPTLSPCPRALSSVTAELLLPNKPKLELRAGPAKSRLSVSDSDGDSGISLGFLAFRPKDPFTLKPPPCLAPRSGRLANQRQPRSGPLKADHNIPILSCNSSLGEPEQRRLSLPTPALPSLLQKRGPSPCRSPAHFRGPTPSTGSSAFRGSTPSRVRFQDESPVEVESRYQERLLLSRGAGGKGWAAPAGNSSTSLEKPPTGATTVPESVELRRERDPKSQVAREEDSAGADKGGGPGDPSSSRQDGQQDLPDQSRSDMGREAEGGSSTKENSCPGKKAADPERVSLKVSSSTDWDVEQAEVSRRLPQPGIPSPGPAGDRSPLRGGGREAPGFGGMLNQPSLQRTTRLSGCRSLDCHQQGVITCQCCTQPSPEKAQRTKNNTAPCSAAREAPDLLRLYTRVKRTLKARVKRMQGPKNSNEEASPFDYIDHTQRGGAVESSSNQCSAQSKKERLYAVTEGAPPAVQ
ncbi:protein capicua homolog [Polyodon spathula]|uniref:protein capicua homolog n=1 Tax=Polyodon spathula TaxID=7913 RepID=UPI001B7F4BFB|nr:protein capicua homolog [Polyodon spathula]